MPCVLTAPLRSDDSPVNDIGERRRPTEGLFRVRPPVRRFEEQESEKHWLHLAKYITSFINVIIISWSLRLHSKNLTACGVTRICFTFRSGLRNYKRTRSAVCSSALRVLPPGTLVKAIRESSSYRPVLEELGAQCIPRISRLVGFFDRFISLLPGSLFKECLLDINLGGMHFVKCLGDGLHVFRRHCGFGHGPKS
jgi:hypothetical protein